MRVQARMLARIVVEICSTDLAVEVEPQCLPRMLTTLMCFPVAPECLYSRRFGDDVTWTCRFFVRVASSLESLRLGSPHITC